VLLQAESLTSPDNIEKFLPLTEATYYIMLALVEPLHGYGVMQRVTEISSGTVKIGPGTLYGAFTTLEKEGLIFKVSEQERRKIYTLTPRGKKLLLRQVERLEIMSRNGLAVSARLALDR
jgi:DNA-binding PadR family transcriptional regulator